MSYAWQFEESFKDLKDIRNGFALHGYRMTQLLGLTPARTRRHTLESLTPNLGPWPSALFGLEIRRKRRQPAPGERELRERIKFHLEKMGFIQKKLAEAMGVRQSSVSNVLVGRDAIPPAWLPLLEGILGLPRGQLLRGVNWQPRRGGHPRRSGPPPPRRRRRELPHEKAMRLRLRALLQEQSLTQKVVASAIGVHEVCISGVLTGRDALPPAWLKPIAKLLNLTVSQVIGDTAWLPRKKGANRRAWLYK